MGCSYKEDYITKQSDGYYKKAVSVFSPEQLWINPDCGLKTRDREETVKNLKNMLKTVDMARKRYKKQLSQECIK